MNTPPLKVRAAIYCRKSSISLRVEGIGSLVEELRLHEAAERQAA